MSEYVKEITDIAYHRNGVGGAGFYVVHFVGVNDNDERTNFIGIVFPHDPRETVAVIDPSNPKSCWRGADYFGPELIKAIEKKTGYPINA